MEKKVFGTSLFIALLATGCAGSQLHQSLLVHENQRLENALYVAHAQVADLKRQNNLLRKQQSNEFIDPARQDSQVDDWDFDTPLEMPKILLPDQPGTTDVPMLIRESQADSIWSPRR